MKQKLTVRLDAQHFFRRLAERYARNTAYYGPVALIGGSEVSKLKPLNPGGFAKSGNISMSGQLGEQRVKVSSMFTTQQVGRRASVSRMSSQIHLPRVIASEGRMIVEEWIDGRPPVRTDHERVRAAIRDYLICEERFAYGEVDAGDFDYLDYLEQRVADWHFIDRLGAFLERWRAQRASVSSELRLALCNPDLHFENFMIEAGTNHIVMIDTEFLHVGQGWFMDHLNSAVRSEPLPNGISAELSLFTRNCFALRQIGSALIVGRPERLTSDLLGFHDD